MQNKIYPYITNLNILGGVIKIKCSYKKCLESIEKYFSESITTEEGAIDIIIYCDLKKPSKYLFRTSPDKPIKDIYYQLNKGNIKKWDDLNPPIPPFVKPPFRQRFTGLHAGAVKLNGKTILFVGAKESGKTTLTTILANKYDADFLTDETVFILNRTNLIEPYPRLILPRVFENNKIIKKQITVTDGVKKVLKINTTIDYIIFLKKHSYSIVPYLQKMTNVESTKLLFENYLYAGSDFNEVSHTLVKLGKNTPAYQFNYNNYDSLLEFSDEITKKI